MTKKYNITSFRPNDQDLEHINTIYEYLKENWPPEVKITQSLIIRTALLEKAMKVTQTDVIRFALYEAFMKVNREMEAEIREAQND
jgi:hypothetical protein